MGQAETKGAVEILRRLIGYVEKVYGLSALVQGIRDRRQRPRIPTQVVIRSILTMFLTRLGSLNALEQTRSSRFWRRWLGAPLPSADSLGRIMQEVDSDTLRQAHRALYRQLKRNKALPATSHGLMALVIDGHESHATYRRRCAGCLERRVKTCRGWRIQYYHRHVTAMLLGGDFPIWLDAEALRPGDDELAAAKRLLARVLRDYPRAFDIVLGDALYSDSQFYALLVRHGKDVLTVLKANQRELLDEAQILLEEVEPVVVEEKGAWREVRDLDGFHPPWSGFDRTVRVVRSRESRRVRRQLDGQSEDLLSEWLWVTTCSPHRAHTDALVRLGHARWDIENQGFNEAVNHWHADHVYKHDANALLTFWLTAMLAFNLFHAFYRRQLKPDRRTSYQHIARSMASDLYHVTPRPQARPP